MWLRWQRTRLACVVLESIPLTVVIIPLAPCTAGTSFWEHFWKWPVTPTQHTFPWEKTKIKKIMQKNSCISKKKKKSMHLNISKAFKRLPLCIPRSLQAFLTLRPAPAAVPTFTPAKPRAAVRGSRRRRVAAPAGVSVSGSFPRACACAEARPSPGLHKALGARSRRVHSVSLRAGGRPRGASACPAGTAAAKATPSHHGEWPRRGLEGGPGRPGLEGGGP